MAAKGKTTTTEKFVPVIGSNKEITVQTTLPQVVPGKARKTDKEGSSWLWPILLGVLALCCILGLIGYLCMNKKPTTKKKTTKKKTATPAKPVTPEVAPSSEVAPLMGHWEQPMQVVPVTTTSSSYTPAVVERAMTAPTYAMPTVVEPAYAMAAPTYAMSAPVATTAYEYATAPTYAAATGYATAPTMVAETFAPTYAATTGYATAPTAVVETFAPTYAATAGYATAPTYAASTYAAPTGYATAPTAFAEAVGPTYAAPGYVV
jgi:hypothetical protein